jgi:hypothetical protein
MTELEQRALAVLRNYGGCSCSNLGAELYGEGRRRKPQAYARPAGKLLKKMAAQGLVRREPRGGRSIWFANDAPSKAEERRPFPVTDDEIDAPDGAVVNGYQRVGATWRPLGEPELTYYCDSMRHLVCVPYSDDNLHRMALDLGIKPCWFHRSKDHHHYDIPKKRIAEIQARCTLVEGRVILAIMKGQVPVASAEPMERR